MVASLTTGTEITVSNVETVESVDALTIVRKLRSESDAQLSVQVPVLRTLAKRTDYGTVHDGKKFAKLQGIATRTIGAVEIARRNVFQLKKTIAQLNDMETLLRNGQTLDAYKESERDNGITFTVFQSGEQSEGELLNSDYGHIRKYAGGANSTATRIIDNSEGAFAALSMQLECILGIVPVEGMEFRIERDSRMVSNVEGAKPRTAESFVFKFHSAKDSATGEPLGLYATCRSLTAGGATVTLNVPAEMA